MSLESAIQSSVLKYLNSLDRCIAENVMGNVFQRNRPDINCCWRGLCIKIELKSPDHKNKPTKGQEMSLRKWAKSGAICFVAYSLKDVKCVINNNGVFNKEEFTGILYTRLEDLY